MHMLEKHGVTDSTKFSIKFENEFKEGATGKLYIGKHEDFSSNSSFTCPLSIFNNENDYYWNLQIDGFGLKMGNKEIMSSKSFNLVIDTATDYIILPMEYLNDIKRNLQQFDCSSDSSEISTYDELQCSEDINSLPDLIFNISGRIVKIPANYSFELNVRHYYSRVYFTRSNSYILGASFFYVYHTLFDKDNETLHFYPNFVDKKDEDEKENEKEKEKEDEKEKEKEEEKEKETDKENENEKETDKENENDKNNDKNKNKENGKESEDGKSGEQSNESGQKPEKKKGVSTFVIVACVIAGVILLVGIALLVYYCVKSKKAKENEEVEKGAENTDPILENNEAN